MFGYVRPLRAALSEEDQQRYQAAYCGLCHSMKKRYGRVANLFLNYDFAFLAMVLGGVTEAADEIRPQRCPVYPTRVRDTWQMNAALELAAGESVILAYWKLKDGIADRGFFRSIPQRIACVALRRAYGKARRDCPAFTQTVQHALADLRELEEAQCQSPDRAADTFAQILRAAAGEEKRPGDYALGQLLYHVGRWIYIIDAWDDLEEDRKQGSYNPLLARYGDKPEEQQQAVRETLYASLATAGDAMVWLSFGAWGTVIENIVTLGLPSVQEAVFSGQWKSSKNRIVRRSKDE